MNIWEIAQRIRQRFSCGDRNGDGKTWLVRRISRKLDLDEQQQERLITLQRHMRSGRESLRQNLPQTREGISEMLLTDNGDNPQLSAFLRDELDSTLYAANTQGEAIIQAFTDFHASLNSQQREQLQRHWQKRQRCFGTSHRHH